jgi:hypothetical protein
MAPMTASWAQKLKVKTLFSSNQQTCATRSDRVPCSEHEKFAMNELFAIAAKR